MPDAYSSYSINILPAPLNYCHPFYVPTVDICAKTADCSQFHSVESGYYRVAWKHVQDNICKEYADRWALYLGRYGECFASLNALMCGILHIQIKYHQFLLFIFCLTDTTFDMTLCLSLIVLVQFLLIGLLEDIVASASKHVGKYLQDTAGTSSDINDDGSSGTGKTEGIFDFTLLFHHQGISFFTLAFVYIMTLLAGATTTSSSTSLHAHHTAGVVGCLRLLSTALLGLASVQSAAVAADGTHSSDSGVAKGTGTSTHRIAHLQPKTCILLI